MGCCAANQMDSKKYIAIHPSQFVGEIKKNFNAAYKVSKMLGKGILFNILSLP